MRRMDPDFAAAFSKESPEAYGATVRSQRRGAAGSADAAIAVHVPVVPPLVIRFFAGIVVMLLLIGAFFLISETTDNRTLGIPSGKTMSAQSGSEFSGAELSRKVSQGTAPLKDVHSGFANGWGNR